MMSEGLIATLLVMAGLYIMVGIHHVGLCLLERFDKTHGYFALTALSTASLTIFRILGQTAGSVDALILIRKFEIFSVCLYGVFLLQFLAEYTITRDRKPVRYLSIGWIFLLVINFARPYGLVFNHRPELSYFNLPWGGRVVDIRLPMENPWNDVLWTYIFLTLAYCLYMSFLGGRRKINDNGGGVVVLATALLVFLLAFNVIVDLRLTTFIHTSDFGFLALIIMMNLSLLEQSQNERRLLFTVLNCLPIGVNLADPNGNRRFVNQAFKTQFGNTLPVGLPSNSPADAEFTWTDESSNHTFEVIQFKIPGSGSNPPDHCSLFIDITQQKSKAESLDKLRNQAWLATRISNTSVIAKMLAHEICQPLAAILNNAQAGLRFLDKENTELEEIKNILQDIVRDEKRAGEVINNLRGMLQHKESSFEVVDLNDIVAEILDLLRASTLVKDVEIIQSSAGEVLVKANKSQLQQVLVNLVINAIEAMTDDCPSGRRIVVLTTKRDSWAIASVSDNGKGIPNDKIDRVFDGFYTTKPQGLGVGLEVCRVIVENHGGKIWAEDNTGEGATFSFALPIAPRQPNDSYKSGPTTVAKK